MINFFIQVQSLNLQAFLVFMATAAIPFFMLQKPVFLRERSNGLIDVTPFIVSNLLSSLPAIGVIAVMSSTIVVNMIGLNGFGLFTLNLFLSLVCSESLMYLLSSFSPHYIIGMALGSGIIDSQKIQ